MGDESAFANLVSVQVLCQCCLAAAAQAVTHDNDFSYLEKLDSEFDCS